MNGRSYTLIKPETKVSFFIVKLTKSIFRSVQKPEEIEDLNTIELLNGGGSKFERDINFVREADWRVVFVKTSEEFKFAERLRQKLDKSKYVVFVPTKERTFRINKEITLRRVIIFKGYVFVATFEKNEDVLETLKPIIKSDKHAIKLLGGDKDFVCAKVGEKEKEFLSRFMNREFNVPAVEIIEENQEIKIKSGVFNGFEGRAIKVDKYRQTVKAEFELCGIKQIVELPWTRVKKQK